MNEDRVKENERITTDYLWHYSNLKMRVALIDNEILEEQTKIKAVTGASIAKYGNDVGGGHGELVGAERSSDLLMQCENSISRLEHEKQFITNLLNRIDIVLKYLPEDQRAVLSHKYIQQETWRQVAGELKTYTNHCRRLAQKGISAVSATLSQNNSVDLVRLRAM